MGGGFYDRTLQNWQHYKMQRWVMRMIVSWWKNSPLKSGIPSSCGGYTVESLGVVRATHRIALIDIVDSLT